MKKNTLSKIYFMVTILLLFSMNIFAQDTPKLFLNGELKSSEIVLKNSNTLVPLRFCSEELNGSVSWDKTTQEITITNGSNKILFTIGSLNYSKNGEAKTLLVAPEFINGVTYVPFRPLVEALDGIVLYNEEYKFINIYTRNSTAYEIYNNLNNKDLNQQRFALLASPRLSFKGSYGGSRSNTYIFPLNQASDYFFRYYIDEGTLFGMDYFQVVDGVAVEKWSRTQSSSSPYEAQSPLLGLLGKGTDISEKGSFPSLKEQSFVCFYNDEFNVYSQDDIMNSFSPYTHISIIHNNSILRLEESIPAKHLFSPYDPLRYLTEFDEQSFTY